MSRDRLTKTFRKLLGASYGYTNKTTAASALWKPKVDAVNPNPLCAVVQQSVLEM